ncbi:MAG: hypothetical protein ACO3HV_07075 [Candidatus Nanopelagicales bacterium]
MTPDDRLEAIFARLGDIEKNSASHHARVEGEMARIGDKLASLDEKIKTQNGRVGRLESQVGELQVKARIAERDDQEDDARHDVVAARMWAFISGSALVVLGALLGYFL